MKRITYSFASISWTNPVYSIQKIAGVVYFDYYCQVTEGIGVTSYGIAKLPQNITPVDHAIKLAAWTADGNGKRNPASVEIKTDGMVDLVSGGDFVEAGFSVSYPI